MKTPIKQAIYWAPRLLAIAVAIFLSLFALDVFGEGYSLWETAVALFMHLLPALAILAILLIAWKWEALGGALFIALGLFFSLYFRGNPWTVSLMLFGPLALAGILFLTCWFYKRRVMLR